MEAEIQQSFNFLAVNCELNSSHSKMETQSSGSSLKTVRYSKCKKWTVREKKIVLTILQSHGHQNVSQFLDALPHRSELEVSRFLKKYISSAERKRCLKYDENVEKTLAAVHPWMPFINSYCSSGFNVHENLAAFTLPFVERYLKHPSPAQSGNINFNCSYRALYNSLVGEKFPEGMNHETFSMIFASLTQLFNKIRTEEINNRTVLLKSAKRCLLKKQPNQSKERSCYSDTAVQLPEINTLNFTLREINEVCQR